MARRRQDRQAEEKVTYSLVHTGRAIVNISKTVQPGLTLKPIVHEIKIQNQVIFLDPPLENSRQIWISQLHEWLGTCSLTRVTSIFPEVTQV